MHQTPTSLRRLVCLAFGFVQLFSVHVTVAQPNQPVNGISGRDLVRSKAESGVIEGRVFNASTGAALAEARIAVEGTGQETFTDDTGSFRLAGVAPGETRLAVTYIGMNAQSATVTVSSGVSIHQEFELSRGADADKAGRDIVRLQKFNVVADREMSAQAVAMNEQRNAPNIKNVVAINEYGDQGDENVLSFMRFLPGVSISDDAPTAGAISIRGFPANNSEVTVDGGDFASARTGSTRTTVLVELPMSNISRIEVTKVPTPDMPASGLGGSINLISKNGFETKKPLFSYQMSTMFFNTGGVTIDGGPKNQIPATSPRYTQPSFSLSYLRPVNKSLAFSAGMSRSWRQVPSRGTLSETPTWNLASLVQTTSDIIFIDRVLQTTTENVGVDWKVTSTDVISAGFQYRETSNISTGNRFLIAYGAGATGSPTFTQGASTAVGTATQQSRASQDTFNKNQHATLHYKHTGAVWRWTSSGSFSRATGTLKDIDSGFFSTTPSSIQSLIIRGADIPSSGGSMPTRYSATTRTGSAVDLYDGGNYSIDSATSAQDFFQTVKTTGSIDISRDFGTVIPFTLKTGAATSRNEKDQRRYSKTWAFRPNGASDVTSRLASKFDVFDNDYNATGPTLYGQPVRWISSPKIYQLYLQHPDWFVLNDTAAYQNLVSNSKDFTEAISAAFVRADLHLIDRRLWLVTGVRFEETAVSSDGPLDDFFAQYQRDANGNFVLDSAGQRVLVTTDALARAKLRFKERAAHNDANYYGFYPSLNATFTISENLVARAAYARTIGRPEVSTITAGATISDPDAALPTITVSNPTLKPWTADSYDLSLESYFVKDGFGSIGVFQKRIKNFFGSVTTPATSELLNLYGLPADPSLLDYDIVTTVNAGDANIRGFELNYRQSLTFLPSWARGLQIFGNTTRMTLAGSNTADFSTFTPQSVAAGVNLIRSRFYLKLNYTHQGLTRRALVAPSASVPANTYTYMPERNIWTLSGQYSLERSIGLFFSLNDINGGKRGTLRYAPQTPEYARRSQYLESGWYTTVGIKGEF